MNYLDLINLKVGDIVTILGQPHGWSSAVGTDGRNKVVYPYVLTVSNMMWNKDAWIPHIAIKDTNGYGWVISEKTVNLFQRNNILIDRKNRIERLNSEDFNELPNDNIIARIITAPSDQTHH